MRKPTDKAKYVQRCPSCGEDYFLDCQDQRVERCIKCGKASIRYVEPVHVKMCRENDETQSLPEEHAEHELQLESVGRYGGHSVVLIWKEEPIIIGREAKCAEFLCNDTRVSGKHCRFICEDGAWYIQDENSTNSTLLNERKLFPKIAEELRKGDSIVLGNQIDSMEFKVVKMQ